MNLFIKNGFVIAAGVLIALEAWVQWWSVRSLPVARVSHVLKLNLPDPVDGAPDIEITEFEELDLDAVAAEILSYDRGRRLRFQGERLMTMDVHYMEHDAGNQQYVLDNYSHEPEVCMTASGAILVADNGNRIFTIGEGVHEAGIQSLRIRCLTFTEPPSDRTVYIYKLIWVPPGFDTKAEPTYDAMKEIWIKRAFARTPWPPTRLILAAVSGAEDEASAWNFFEETILKRVELVEGDGQVEGGR